MAEFVEVMMQKDRMCYSYEDCEDCPALKYCSEKSKIKELEKVIMNWAKEHPIKTNADKFREVFGFDTSTETSFTFCPFINDGCDSENCETCGKHDFWNQEYKEPKKGEEKCD